MNKQHRPAYPAELAEPFWQIVIPISGKLSPLVWKANFPTQELASVWLASEFGRRFVAATQTAGRLPPYDGPEIGDAEVSA